MHHGSGQSLLAEVATDPEARLLASVSGVGGSGKSALLDALEAEYRAAGVAVRQGNAGVDSTATASAGVMLVDDAHQLSEPALNRIYSLALDGQVNLIVAYRPWPRPAALGRLARALGERHSPIALGALTRDEIASHAAASYGGAAPSSFIDQVTELTGGQPWLVYRMIASVRPDGRHGFGDPRAVHETIQQLGSELEGVREELRALLLALTVGFDLSGRMPPGLEQGGASVDSLATEARAAGLLLPDGHLVPVVRQALLEITPRHQVRALQRVLVDAFTEEGRSLGDVARRLAREGFADLRVARTLERAGDRALAADPVLASALYDEAGTAGSDELAIAARRAQAAAASGDLDTAWHIVDDLLAHEGAPDLARGVDVAAELWATRGMLSRSAEAYRWLGPTRAGASGALAVVAMIGTGDREGADAMLAAGIGNGSPTLLAVAMASMGEGIRHSVRADHTPALPALIRASDMMTAARVTSVPLPETPAALAAMLAVHTGELSLADSVIDAALVGDQGGPVARPRLLLLRAWVAMLSDRPDRARSAAESATESATTIGCGLAPRDALLLAALEVGLARRMDDGPALIRAWRRAREAVLHVTIDLYSLLPLGELMVAAARLRDSGRLEAALAEAWGLLARLGNPPLWSVPLHWSAVQAGILAERPGELAPHATALVHSAERYHMASVLASAGRVWMSVLAGEVDVARVEAAARGLASIGLTWDGSRLAGHAAPHAEERKDMARLLACARDLHPGSSAANSGSPASGWIPSGSTHSGSIGPEPTRGGASATHEATATADEAGLSVREREVARLVLDGKTYREIGETIFISPRTAEHHIARMRQRLGATSRSELLVQLRLALDDEAAPAD
jgi:DNA-binding CsgD family transcriptional regulator